MNSCIYEGRVRHRRRSPKIHRFNFDTYMLWLDLDELTEVFTGRWLWSAERPALARFQESDHLTAYTKSASLRERVLECLNAHEFSREIGSIRLLTQLRYLGFAMNPVSFYYCYDSVGETVVAVIAEVNNTPWGEQHVYVIPNIDSEKTVVAQRVEKDFHVSPFMSLDMYYRMMFTPPDCLLGIKMENFENEARIFDVSMLLERKPLTSWNLNWLLLSYPLISLKIFAGIYWQAFVLYLKRIPVYPHPNRKSAGRLTPAEKRPGKDKPESLTLS